ncbi:MAG: molybdate ABC transporter substrate-binding protein [Eubacteriales bacterium]|nr:molybdate ABC transporter substrate-binding protein [Eubacteriales bacterium]
MKQNTVKKALSLLASACLLWTLAACGSAPAAQNDQPDSQQAEPVEVVVFAAASMEATLTEIAKQYKTVAPSVELLFTFDSSGTLRTQIEQGAVCDLFISAAQKQMDQLDRADTTGVDQNGNDLVLSDTRVDLVENQVVLAVPEGDPAGVASFDDLRGDRLSLLCLGNDDVPVGSYSRQILSSLGIDRAALEQAGKVTYASNVSEVANQVREGAVDCGIIYATDAYTYGLTVVDRATADLCDPIVYPAAVMKCASSADSQAAAQAFLDYLRTDADAIAVLEGVGFSVVPAA